MRPRLLIFTRGNKPISKRGRLNMSKYSKDDIIRIAEEEDVEFIRLQFTDIFGMLKNVAITSSQLARALENRCMFDGSAIEGFVRIDESDMYLFPDLDTFEIFPWRPQQGRWSDSSATFTILTAQNSWGIPEMF